jgi:hypothetical protein
MLSNHLQQAGHRRVLRCRHGAVGKVQAAADRDGQNQGEGRGSGQRNGASQQETGSSNGASGAGRSGGFGELGPIALSFAEDQHDRFGRCVVSDDGMLPGVEAAMFDGGCCRMLPAGTHTDATVLPSWCCSDDEAAPSGEQPRSISSLSTEEWRARYEQDGAVDLWVEEEFNSGSRLTVRPVAPPGSCRSWIHSHSLAPLASLAWTLMMNCPFRSADCVTCWATP